MKLSFTILTVCSKPLPFEFDTKHIINAGYTGRDQKAVQAHIDELKEEGIPAPKHTPTYFPKFIDRITQNNVFEVLDEADHSGEAEFVLLFQDDRVFVGVGSDHTDRKLEGIDIQKAKQVYPNTISRDLWDLGDVEGHWDKLVLRSWVKTDGMKSLFQEATLDVMLDPADLIRRVKVLLLNPNDLNGLVVYSGTVAAAAKVSYSDYFETELEDPVLERRLSQHYMMRPIDKWFKGEQEE